MSHNFSASSLLLFKFVSFKLLWTSAYDQAKAGPPARTYIQQLCEDTGCNPEDLPKAMNDREKWRERVRDIRSGGTTWWWWWWLIPLTVSIYLYIGEFSLLFRSFHPFIFWNPATPVVIPNVIFFKIMQFISSFKSRERVIFFTILSFYVWFWMKTILYYFRNHLRNFR